MHLAGCKSGSAGKEVNGINYLLGRLGQRDLMTDEITEDVVWIGTRTSFLIIPYVE